MAGFRPSAAVGGRCSANSISETTLRWRFFSRNGVAEEPCVGYPDGPQCREFYAALRHIGTMAGCNLRLRDISKLNWTSTVGQAAPWAPGWAMALVAGLLLATALFSGAAHAAIDGAKVSVDLVARPDSASGAGQEFKVPNGSALRTGDGVQLRLASDIDAYVYVIAYGSSNTAIFLHPFSAKPEDALIRSGKTEVVPESGVFLPLDDREGSETLFTIISDVPLTDMAELLPRIEAYEGDAVAIVAMLAANYPSVRHLSFKHIGATPLVGVATSTPRSSTAPGSAEGSAGFGASSRPAAGGDWSTSSSQGFGAGEAAAGGAAASAGIRGQSSTSSDTAAAATQTPLSASPRVPVAEPAGEAATETVKAPVSPALRRAREAAGIDEKQFHGMLATLPDSNQAQVPESMRTSDTEQGVLGAEGSRIRAFGGGQAQSDGDSQNKLQN